VARWGEGGSYPSLGCLLAPTVHKMMKGHEQADLDILGQATLTGNQSPAFVARFNSRSQILARLR